MICVRACIGKSAYGNRIQINPGTKVLECSQYGDRCLLQCSDIGYVNVSREQFLNNFGTPISKKREAYEIDTSDPIGLVEVFE